MDPSLRESKSVRMPDYVMPSMGSWFWTKVLQPSDYEKFIDTLSLHAPYNLLTTSFRIPGKEITGNELHQQIKGAAEYAQKKGISLVVDLDVRLARRAFESRYPDELQEMLMLKQVKYTGTDSVRAVVRSMDLNDHYTHRTTHYISLKGALLRTYAYRYSGGVIDPESLTDITFECNLLSESKDSVTVMVPCDHGGLTHACVMVSFTHLAPDVFAPHLMEFQRQLIRDYADVPLAGVCKDEWGFPPCFAPTKSEFWYSGYRAGAYAKRTDGRDLLEDCLLMSLGIEGQERERRMAINHFMEMSYQRNSELEVDFYNSVKEVFGPLAVTATHPTWWPYPDAREYKKNGLAWWGARRDWAQTDELTPYAVRTSLAKKWQSPVWYNMYYANNVADYERSVWSHALAGGRINYHPLYPGSESLDDRTMELLKGDLMRAECRIRLLNYITQTPLDCPVAVIFGHACTMNWAGPAYDDVGMELVDSLWQLGFPADLIPSSEIRGNQLHIDDRGWITYGLQRYAAVVLYHPEFEEPATAGFFSRAADGPTRMYRIGEWTQDFNGQDYNGSESLPASMIAMDNIHAVIPEIRKALQAKGIGRVTPSVVFRENIFPSSSSPPTTGFCRLIDGTMIRIAGTEHVGGDPIHTTMEVDGHTVFFDAVGMAAIRLDNKGRVEAMAAGGLKSFKSTGLEITLNDRTDMALWRNERGKWEGVIQGTEDDVPPELLKITGDWSQLALPLPYHAYSSLALYL